VHTFSPDSAQGMEPVNDKKSKNKSTIPYS
jgi:hypothetical protein